MHGLPDDYANLPTFTDSFFFFGDELHMLGHGIGHLIYKLIHPSTFDFYRALNSSSYTFDFIDGFSRKQVIEQIGDCIYDSKPTSSSAFNYSFDRRFSFYRAVDWQQWLLYIVPTMVIPKLKSRAVKEGLMALVNACAIAFQKEISTHELEKMDQ